MQTHTRSWRSLAIIAGVTALAPLLGARHSKPGPWYRSLRKPPQTPPGWVFGPVWTLLYTLSAVSLWRVWQHPPSRRRRASVALWAVQHGLNAAWSPLFFAAHRPRAALVDLGGLLACSTAYAVTAGRLDRTAGWLFAPYVGGVAFAGTINAGIVALNPRRLSW